MANLYSTKLNGTSQWWSIASGAQTGLDFSGNCTFEYWFKPGTINVDQGGIVQWYNNGTAWVGVMFFITSNNKLQLRIVDASGNITQSTSTAVVSATGTWACYSGSFNASTKAIALYKNGSPIATTIDSANASSIDNDGAWEVGARNSELFSNGSIDEARIWNIVRTPAEILANYNKELVGTESGLKAYLKFENNGDDSTSNGNDFTNNGSATFTGDIPFGSDLSYTVTGATADYYSLSNCGKSIVRTSDGVLHITYALLSGTRDIYYANSSDNGETWGNQAQLTNIAYSNQSPSIATDSNDNLHIVWVGKNATYTSNNQVFYGFLGVFAS